MKLKYFTCFFLLSILLTEATLLTPRMLKASSGGKSSSSGSHSSSGSSSGSHTTTPSTGSTTKTPSTTGTTAGTTGGTTAGTAGAAGAAGATSGTRSPSTASTTKSESYGDRVGQSFAAFIFGIVLIFLSIPVLWFNERRAVKMNQIIDSGQNICIEARSSPIESKYEDELVCINGQTSTKESLVDGEFGVVAENSVKLKRKIEVYQMKETTTTREEEDQIGGGKKTITDYHYDPDWCTDKIDSQAFFDVNFRDTNNEVEFITTDNVMVAPLVKLGSFELNTSQKERLEKYEDLQMNNNLLTNLPQDIKSKIDNTGPKNLNVEGKYLMVRRERGKTEIGDTRISFEVVKCGPVTVVAIQKGDSFIPYNIKEKRFKRAPKSALEENEKTQLIDKDETSNFDKFDKIMENLCMCCWCCGFVSKLLKEDETIDWVFEVGYTKDQAFTDRSQANHMTTNIIRLAGWLLLVIGIKLLFSPIIMILSIIKILGQLVGFAAWIISFIIGSLVSAITIAIAWIAYRPTIALAVIGASTCILMLVWFNRSEEIPMDGEGEFLPSN